MKKSTLFFAVTLTASLFLFSCGSKSEPASDATNTDTTDTTPAVTGTASSVAVLFPAGAMPAQGSKIYIAPAGKANKVGAHLTNAVQSRGYWTVAGNKNDAEFIMQPVVDEKGMSISGYVVLKNMDGSTIMQSPKFKAISFAGNGFSCWRGFGTQVGKWLKGK